MDSSDVHFFEPHRYFKNKHLQTILNVIQPPDNRLRTGFYCEDILISTNDKSGDSLLVEHNPPVASYLNGAIAHNGYYLLLLHGMEGDSESPYLVSLASAALTRGYGTIRVNLRGCGKGDNFAVGSYHAGKSEDIETVENFIYKNFSKKIILCGFSLSANMVLKYMGEKRKRRANLFSAVSPPLDLKETCSHIDSPESWFYRDHFLKSLKDKIRSGIYNVSPYMAKKALEAETMFDFDDVVSAPLGGFKGALDYYKHCSSKNFIYNIKAPGIVVHADDDPLIPPHEFTEILWTRIPNLKNVLTKGGGHVGFISNKSAEIPDGRWLDKILLDYFDSHIK